jgi:DNA-binding MarR family transcriptional regulator
VNYSDRESYGNRTDDEALIEAGLRLLPVIGASLFAGISQLGQAYRLTPAQVKVLLQLGAHGQMTVGEIGAALGVSMPAASELVDRLVDAGHLVRTSDPADRRRVLVAASPESQRIGAELRDLRRAQLRRALEHLAPEERPTFIRALEALVVGLEHGANGAPPCPVGPVDAPVRTASREGATSPAHPVATIAKSRGHSR